MNSFANPLPLHEGSPIFVFNKSKNLKQRWTASTQLFRPHGTNHKYLSPSSCIKKTAELKRENDLLQQRIGLLLISQVGTPIVCQVVQIAALVRSRTTHFNKYLASSPRNHLFPQLWLRENGTIPTRSWFLHRARFHLSSHYAGHSLRSGGAIALAVAGAPAGCIQTISRWPFNTLYKNILSYSRHSSAMRRPLTSASFNAMYRLSITTLAHHLPTPHLLVSILLGIESPAIQRPRLAVYSYSHPAGSRPCAG